MKVRAIVCSDIHLTLKPPIARAGEANWLDAQARTLRQVIDLSQKYNAPVLIAGDVFDRWNAPVELVNFAIDHMPYPAYAIAGQHDLPAHRLEAIASSAFYTLMKSGNLVRVLPSGWNVRPSIVSPMHVAGVSWGEEIPAVPKTEYLKVILIHSFIWDIRANAYPGAPKENRLKSWRRRLRGWDVAIFGDNHAGFVSPGTPFIFNCGTLMRRKADEIAYKPQVGLILDDGSVRPYYLDTSDEKMEPVASSDIVCSLDLQMFIRDLNRLHKDPLDFREAVKRAARAREKDDPVRRLLMEAIDGSS